MKKWLPPLVFLVLLPLGLYAGLRGLAASSEAAVAVGLAADGASLRPCPPSPNCVCSQGEGDAAVEPLRFEGDPDAAFRSLLEFLGSEPRARLVTVDGDYAHAVVWTPYLKFVDDVELLLDREASVVHVRSASRVGYSDLGTNRARVEWIRSRWRFPLASPATAGADG